MKKSHIGRQKGGQNEKKQRYTSATALGRYPMRGSNPTTKLSRQCLAVAIMTIAMGALPFTGSTVLAQGLELEEIIVTAQRREENLQEVPVSVTPMGGERLTSLFEGGETILALATRLLNNAGTLMGRFSVLSQNRDDWIDNGFTGRSRSTPRVDSTSWPGERRLRWSLPKT